MQKDIPAPGSDEAIELGCLCPRMDNGYGKGYMGIAGQYVIVEGCPVHPMPSDAEGRADA